MTHRGRCIHFSSQAPRRSQLIESSSALALRACPPQLVAARSAPRLALRARSRCALARHSSSQAPRRSRCALASSAARAARSPATARCTLLGGSRCALARHGSSQAPPLELAFSSARLLFGFAKSDRCGSPAFRTRAELDRSSPSSLKQAQMYRTSRRSSQLPWPPKPPHAQSHKLFDNCSPHLIGSGPQLS